MIVPRTAAATLQNLAQSFPVVAVIGPRQSGKTTLVQSLFPDKPYVSLEELDVREYATTDPRGFLSQFPDGAIFDEVQRCPDLFSYIQSKVDQDKRAGLFVLTGSQQFGLLSAITQSLAGRVALLTLLPFSLSELQTVQEAPDTVEHLLFQGLYPPLYDRSLEPVLWYDNYTRTYLERDVRQLINVQDLGSFQRFIRLCAAHVGQLVNFSNLSNDVGISHHTVKSWLSVLEASYIIHFLQPHHQNFSKRLIKSPKLYFHDTGLACRLLGIQNAGQLVAHPLKGALFESWVVSEMLKARFNQGLSSNLFFWRDQTGNEIDLIIDHGNLLSPVEIKSGQTVTSDFFKGLKHWLHLAQEKAGPAWLIYGGNQAQSRPPIEVVPWTKLDSLNP